MEEKEHLSKHLDKKKMEIALKMVHKAGKESKRAYGYKDFHKRSQKGRESLNIPRGEKNEGNNMYEGKNENNRQ